MNLPKNNPGQKIAIVFEDVGALAVAASGQPGHEFKVYLSGSTRDLSKLPVEEMTTAEFWAYRCFQIVCQVITQAGAKSKPIEGPVQ